MTAQLIRHDGVAVLGSRTKSGVFAAFQWEQLTLPPFGSAIQAKAAMPASIRLRGFPAQDHPHLCSQRGHYCDLQSINSEDTVTWGIFGDAVNEGWLPDFLSLASGGIVHPTHWTARFWMRTPHPRTGRTTGGPECDVLLEAPGWRYVVEAKWASDIGVHKFGEDQLEMRSLLAASSTHRGGVIVIVPSPALFTGSHKIFNKYFAAQGDKYMQREPAIRLNARALTWEAMLPLLPPARRAFLKWRLSLFPNRVSLAP